MCCSWAKSRMCSNTSSSGRKFNSTCPWFGYNQYLFRVPLKGGRWYIITQLAVYTTYIPHILPIGWLYATYSYHSLREPGNSIDIRPLLKWPTRECLEDFFRLPKFSKDTGWTPVCPCFFVSGIVNWKPFRDQRMQVFEIILRDDQLIAQ